jgi:glycosidase
VRETGIKREINRQELSYTELESELADANSLRHKVLREYLRLLKARCSLPALNPYSKQEVINGDERALILYGHSRDQKTIALINLTRGPVKIKKYRNKRDAISGKSFGGILEPYGVCFLI